MGSSRPNRRSGARSTQSGAVSDAARPSNDPRSRRPPSGDNARVWTLLAVFWLWLLLPVAIHYQRKARREAELSDGLYIWPRSLWNRPVALWLVVLLIALGFTLAMAAIGVFGP
jgi:hypothetical protein